MGNPNLPIIIDDKDYNFHDEFHDIYPTNVFIDNEMKIHAILDTLDTAESVNVRIQGMLDNMDLGCSGNADMDCAGVCGGNAAIDECGVCNEPICNDSETPAPFTLGNNPCQLEGEYPISTLWNSTCDLSLLSNKILPPIHFKINNLFPNPFNPVLNINFDIAWSGITQVNILDISGSHIETLYSGFLQSGSHDMSWNAESVPSGVYFISLKLGDKRLTEKVVLLK